MPESAIIWKGEPMTPPRIFCIGKNYADHVKEMGDQKIDELVVFMKPTQSITDILRAEDGEALHYEGEITFLLENGKPVGVGFGLDLTKRKMQGALKKKGLPWERSKAFRGSALFSDFTTLEDPLETLEIILEEDGQVIQHGRLPEMIHSPEDILKGLSAFQNLEDGDLVMTGTPAGVGQLKAGQKYLGRVLSKGRELVSKQWHCI